jgi:hypothetical protein
VLILALDSWSAVTGIRPLTCGNAALTGVKVRPPRGGPQPTSEHRLRTFERIVTSSNLGSCLGGNLALVTMRILALKLAR